MTHPDHIAPPADQTRLSPVYAYARRFYSGLERMEAAPKDGRSIILVLARGNDMYPWPAHWRGDTWRYPLVRLIWAWLPERRQRDWMYARVKGTPVGWVRS